VAAVAAPVPALAAGPDAELIALCAQFDTGERQYLAIYEQVADDDAADRAAAPIRAAQRLLLNRICAIRATTLEGFRARIRTVMLEDQELDPTAEAETGEWYFNVRLMAVLLRDLAFDAGALRPDGSRFRGLEVT